jgi:hypothetical protein
MWLMVRRSRSAEEHGRCKEGWCEALSWGDVGIWWLRVLLSSSCWVGKRAGMADVMHGCMLLRREAQDVGPTQIGMGSTAHRQDVLLPQLTCRMGCTFCAASFVWYSSPVASLPIMPTNLMLAARSWSSMLARPFITLAALPPGSLQQDEQHSIHTRLHWHICQASFARVHEPCDRDDA